MVSTSTVTALATAALVLRSSALWSTASTRTFCSTTSVEALPFSSWRVSTTSTRSPGSTKPPTPSTSLTRTDTAFMPSPTSAESVARWPGPVIFTASTGSLASTGESTVREPACSTSAMVAKAPSGSALAGHGTSRRCSRASSTPKGSRCCATTMVLVDSGFFCASRLFNRRSAWLFSHACAMKTASSPKTTANPTITIVDLRTTASRIGGALFTPC